VLPSCSWPGRAPRTRGTSEELRFSQFPDRTTAGGLRYDLYCPHTTDPPSLVVVALDVGATLEHAEPLAPYFARTGLIVVVVEPAADRASYPARIGAVLDEVLAGRPIDVARFRRRRRRGSPRRSRARSGRGRSSNARASSSGPTSTGTPRRVPRSTAGELLSWNGETTAGAGLTFVHDLGTVAYAPSVGVATPGGAVTN
jgi:hypothetical protein